MKVNDETLIAALIRYGSHKRVSEELGISMNTITNRLKKDSFRQLYDEAKAALLEETVDDMKAQLSCAVDTLTSIMNDKTNPATVRVSAADSLLRHTVRYIGAADIERRIISLERGEEDELGQPFESS